MDACVRIGAFALDLPLEVSHQDVVTVLVGLIFPMEVLDVVRKEGNGVELPEEDVRLIVVVDGFVSALDLGRGDHGSPLVDEASELTVEGKRLQVTHTRELWSVA